MMTDHMLVLSMNVLLCTSFVYRFGRALSRRRITNGASIYIWGVFFSLYLIAALTVNDVEHAIDVQFGGLPVALVVRSLLGFGAAHLVYLSMGKLHRWVPHVRAFFLRFSVFTTVAFILLFFGMAHTDAISTGDIALFLKAVRDITMIGWFIIMLLPSGITMMRRETMRLTRFRSLLIVVCFTTLLTQFASELGRIFAVVYGSAIAPILFQIERVASYGCYLLFFAILIPHRSLMLFFYPRMLWQYMRLLWLVKRVAPQTTRAVQTANLFHPDNVDMAMYDIVMIILDHYHKLPESAPLRRKIQRIVERDDAYPDLVRQLVSIRA